MAYNSGDQLDQLLDKARRSGEVFSLKDAQQALQSPPTKMFKGKSLFTQPQNIFIMTSITFIAAISTLMLLHKPSPAPTVVEPAVSLSAPQEPTTKTAPVQTPKPEINPVRPKAASISTTSSTPLPAVDTPRKPQVMILNRQEEKVVVLESSSPDSVFQTHIKENKVIELVTGPLPNQTPCETDPHYPQLSEEALKKLGFAVKDDLVMFESKGKNKARFSLYLNEKNMGLTKSGGLERLEPLFVSDCNQQFIAGFRDQSKVSDYEEMAPSLFPVPVRNEGEKKTYIFWFQKTGRLKEKLPADILQKLDKYSFPFKAAKNPEPTIIPAIPQLNGPARAIPLVNESQLVKLPADMLREMSIEHSKDGIRINQANLKLAMSDSFIFMDVRNPMSLEELEQVQLKKLPPLFVTPGQIMLPSSGELPIHQLMDLKDYDPLESGNNKIQTFFELQPRMLAFPTQDSLLLWFYPTERLLEALPPTEQEKAGKYLAHPPAQPFQLSDIMIQQESILDMLEETLPTEEAVKAYLATDVELQTLGISRTPAGIQLDMSNDISLVFTKAGVIIDRLEAVDVITTITPTPVYVTDRLGRNKRISVTQDGQDSFELQTLIPVQVSSGLDYKMTDKVKGYADPDLIFWYQPTEKFLSSLNDSVALAMQKVLNLANQWQHSSPEPDAALHQTGNCQWLEVCKNQKGKISEMRVYPNPAGSSTQLELKLEKNAQVSVRLTALNGALIREEQFEATTGKNSHQIDLQNLSQGMYLLIIQTDQGDLRYERILVHHN